MDTTLRRRRFRTSAAVPTLALLLALTVAGCGGPADQDGEDPAGADPDTSEPTDPETDPEGADPEGADTDGEDTQVHPSEPETGDGGTSAPQDDPRVAEAQDDLAERSGVDADQIEIVSWRAVAWSDGSIGCPEEGMSYTQALVDGYELVLAAQDAEYHYHAAGEEDLFYCANPQEPIPLERS